MRRFWTLALPLVLAACVPPVSGQRTLVINPLALSLARGAVSGQRQKIETLTNDNPDCTSQGYGTVRILVPAAEGRIDIGYDMVFTTFNRFSPEFICNRKRSPATIVYYTSYPGYVGPDTATIQVLSTSGALHTFKFRIQVLPAAIGAG